MRRRSRWEFNEHAWRHPLALVGLCIGLWLLFQLRALVITVLFALTLASAIAPISEKLEAKAKVPRFVTVLLIYFVVGCLYSVVAVVLFPTIKEQAIRLYNELPRYASGLTETYAHVKELLGENASAINVSFSATEVKAFMSKASREALHFTSDLLGVIVTGILVLFLTAYFVVEAPKIWPKLLQWVPRHNRTRIAGVIKPLESRLGGYVKGQILVSIFVATFLGIGLTAIRVEHGLVLGVLAGLMNLVPFVGSMLTAVLASIVAFNQGPQFLGMTVGLFVAEQWLESNFIVPHFLGNEVELHPLVVLLAILVGAGLMGLPGALIAVPITTALIFLAEEFYLRPMHEEEQQELSLDTDAARPGSEYALVEAPILPVTGVTRVAQNDEARDPSQVIETAGGAVIAVNSATPSQVNIAQAEINKGDVPKTGADTDDGTV